MSLEVLAQIKSKGNVRLLEESLIVLFCSQRCPGVLIFKTYDLARSIRDAVIPLIGGFQTQMERSACAYCSVAANRWSSVLHGALTTCESHATGAPP